MASWDALILIHDVAASKIATKFIYQAIFVVAAFIFGFLAGKWYKR